MPAQDLSRRVDAACRRASGAVGVERAVSATLREAVPFDAWCVLTVDPATLLGTGGYHEEGVPHDRLLRLCEIESAGQDALALPQLARSGQRAGTLTGATGGRLDSSPRYREIFAPSGLQEELRLLFTTGSDAWGAFIALRHIGEPDFTKAEVALVERATGNVAAAIRRELLLTEIADNPVIDHGPGMVLIDDALHPRSITSGAQRWLDEIDDGIDRHRQLPYALLTLAARARDEEPSTAVRARMRTRTGRWLTLHAEPLDELGDICVIIEPTRPIELAELIADAYGLTTREREVVRLLAIGHSRPEIAKLLNLSPHTVDDHVKRALAKVHVRSRAELTAKLFFDQNLPRSQAGVPVGGTGWFLR